MKRIFDKTDFEKEEYEGPSPWIVIGLLAAFVGPLCSMFWH